MKWNEAIRRLEACEAELRRLVGEAAAEGDYGSVLRITEWARAVSALAAEGRPAEGVQPPSPPVVPAAASSARAVRRSRAAAGEYPRFFRRGDELVKVGWSKKDRREYNHRAPRRAIDAVAAAVRRLGEKGRLFTGDALLPLKGADGAAVPDYQAYVALAWLKHLGVVEQHGRKAGYSLVPEKQIDSVVTTAWPELAEWRG